MRRPTEPRRIGLTAFALAVLLASAPASFGQNPPRRADYTLRRDVDLVVIHTTVLDGDGRVVTDLDEDNFTVSENGVQQHLERFVKEAVPVTVGLVLDNSASMAPKRAQMMAAAQSFVEIFNEQDEFFVVNFNVDYYLDLEKKDFTSDPADVDNALARTRTRGGTAMYDALRGSLEHIRGGTRGKKILFTLSDGIDGVSVASFETLLEEARQSNVSMYFIQIPCTEDDNKSHCRRAKRQMRKLADATGGMAYFPLYLGEIQDLARRTAHDIRNQYVLGYTPANREKDGAFRKLQVKVKAKGYGKLEVRHRPGYYARSDHQGAQ